MGGGVACGESVVGEDHFSSEVGAKGDGAALADGTRGVQAESG